MEMDDLISRRAALEAIKTAELGCEYEAVENLPSAQPDRSLWFRIGEICVDESKGFITAGRAFEKIRELLREVERRTDGN